MGSGISGILAILFMDKLENIALSSNRLISPHKRNVDDMVPSTSKQQWRPNFTTPWMAYVHDWSLRSRNPLHHQMASPYHSKTSKSLSLKTVKAPLISTKSQQKSRYLYTINEPYLDTRRSTPSATNENIAFDDILHLNGYPESVIDETKRPQNHQQDHQIPNTEWSYRKIPFISKRLDHKITKFFRREGFPVRVAHKHWGEFSLTTLKLQGADSPEPTAHLKYQLMPKEKHRLPSHMQ